MIKYINSWTCFLFQFHSKFKNKNKNRETWIGVWNSEIESLFTLGTWKTSLNLSFLICNNYNCNELDWIWKTKSTRLCELGFSATKDKNLLKLPEANMMTSVKKHFVSWKLLYMFISYSCVNWKKKKSSKILLTFVRKLKSTENKSYQSQLFPDLEEGIWLSFSFRPSDQLIVLSTVTGFKDKHII